MRASWGFLISPPRLRLAGCCLYASALALGCGVDDRSLTIASGSIAGGGSSGSNGGAPADSAGAGGVAPVDLPVCVYDGELAEGCATLVANPGFAKNIDSWKAEPGMLSSWVANDATASMTSGSLRVLNFLHGETDGVAPGAAAQCIPARAFRTYDVAGDVFIKEGQGAGTPLGEGEGMTGPPYTGKAGLSLFFFGRPDCQENSIGNADSPWVDQPGTWAHSEATGNAPEGTRSLLVRLNTLMPFRENSFEALFDNIFVRQR